MNAGPACLCLFPVRFCLGSQSRATHNTNVQPPVNSALSHQAHGAPLTPHLVLFHTHSFTTGASEHDLLTRITETLGPLPSWLLGEAKHTEKYFKRVPLGGSQNPVGIAMSPSAGGDVGLSLSSSVAGAGGAWDHLASSVPRHVQPPPFPQSLTSARGPQQGAPSQWGASGNHHAAQVAGDTSLLSTSAPPAGGASRWVLRTAAEFEARNGCKAPAGKRYFQHTRLADIIAAYPLRSGLSVSGPLQSRLCAVTGIHATPS
jgi:hypothetical protein